MNMQMKFPSILDINAYEVQNRGETIDEQGIKNQKITQNRRDYY